MSECVSVFTGAHVPSELTVEERLGQNGMLKTVKGLTTEEAEAGGS